LRVARLCSLPPSCATLHTLQGVLLEAVEIVGLGTNTNHVQGRLQAQFTDKELQELC